MEKIENPFWVFYVGDASSLESNKCGKWMYFFDNVAFVAELCNYAVENSIVVEAKHSNASTGVTCFYLNGDDIVGHKRVISFFLEKGLIKKTKKGNLYNISFKYDTQTRAGEYGEDFQSEIKLSNFVDLTTGNWIM